MSAPYIAPGRHVATWNSVAAFGDWWRDEAPAEARSRFQRETRSASEWFWQHRADYTDAAGMIARCTFGNARNLAAARELMRRLEHHMPTLGRKWTSGVAGSFASVADVVAGLPTPMRRFVRAPTERAPIRLFLNTTTSASITAEMCERRGITFLALALYLQAQRATELYVVADLNSGEADAAGNRAGFAVVRVPLANVSLSVAACALTDVGFTRGLCYNALQSSALFNCGGGWAHFMIDGAEQSSARAGADIITATRAYLNLTPQDVYIPGALRSTLMDSNPEAWLDHALAAIAAGKPVTPEGV